MSIYGIRQNENLFDRNIKWNRDKKIKIKFLEDKWVKNRPLKERYPRIYKNPIIKEHYLVYKVLGKVLIVAKYGIIL